MPDRTEVPDGIEVENHGSLWLVRPLTAERRDQLKRLVGKGEEVQWFAGALVVEPRYVEDIVAAVGRGEGLDA